MATQTIVPIKNKALQPLLKELREIRYYLKKLLVIIPEESLQDYKNSAGIKKAHLKALKSFPSLK